MPELRLFRGLAVVTAVAVYLQVVLGSVVRITGSGLGCPDWPLCHGQLVPAVEYHTMIEYAHRLVGTTAGLLMVATAAYAVVLFRRGVLSRGLAGAATGAVLLIVLQGIIGGITVLMKNSPFTVAMHLGGAELVLGAATVVALWAFTGEAEGVVENAARARVAILSGVVSAYVIVVSGSLVVGAGASAACPGWPQCAALPSGLAAIHMLHRIVVLLGSAAILAAGYAGLRRWRGGLLGIAAVATAALLLAEILVGAAQVLNGLPAALRSTHVALASATWVGTVLMAAGLWLVPRTAPGTAPAGALTPAEVGS